MLHALASASIFYARVLLPNVENTPIPATPRWRAEGNVTYVKF